MAAVQQERDDDEAAGFEDVQADPGRAEAALGGVAVLLPYQHPDPRDEQEAAGGEGSLSEARRAAKETEGGAAGARSDAVPIARKADVQNEEPQGGGSATPTSKSGAQEEKPAARERVAQVTERPATERKTTLAEDLAAFRASFDSRDEKAKSANGESERHT